MADNILSKSHYGKLLFEKDSQFFSNLFANIVLSITFVNKTLGATRVSDYKYYSLPLKECVSEVNITSDIYKFGHRCTLKLMSVENNILRMLENSEHYHCVINIGVGDSVESLSSNADTSYTQVEPYIFEVEDVKTINSEGIIDSIFVRLTDIFSATAKKHSWASLVKWYPLISQASSYTSIIESVFTYIKDIISYESNKVYEIEKDLYCEKDELESQEIVQMTLKRIKPDASIYEALEEIWKDLSVTFEYTSQFEGSFEKLESGKPLIPAILQDEYDDVFTLYKNGLNKSTSETEEGEVTVDSSAVTSLDIADKTRNMCLRSILAPFILGFTGGNGATNRGMMWDVINPPSETLPNDPSISPIGTGINSETPILKFIKYPLSPKIAYKGWKNYVFQTETVGGDTGGKGQFIFYNWVKSLFDFTFFNVRSVTDQRGEFLSTILPGFAALETSTDRSTGSAATLNFNEANCVVKPIKTQDFEQEVHLNIGKELSSLLLWSNEYLFVINGSLTRRPNELVKLYVANTSGSTTSSTSSIERNNSNLPLDETFSPFIILYLTSVSHVFNIRDNTYTNHCYGVRPCVYIPTS